MHDDLLAMIEAAQHARLDDFLRYVGRRRREEPELDAMPFTVAFNVCLGGYVAMAAAGAAALADDDVVMPCGCSSGSCYCDNDRAEA